MKTPQQYIDIMMENDHFSKWLGITILELEKGYCKLQMTVRSDMLNGFNIVHGGILFSMADSAFAFASNGEGRLSVALDASISFSKSVKRGELLIAEAKEQSTSYKTGLYMVEIKNEKEVLVALFKGTVYRTSKLIGNSELSKKNESH